MTQPTGKAPELDLELDSEIADGIYSNLAIISHSASEFIVDFATILPGLAKPKIRSRIILTPEHAKRLLLSLQDNIAKYESTNGLIPSDLRPPKRTPCQWASVTKERHNAPLFILSCNTNYCRYKHVVSAVVFTDHTSVM